MSKIKAGWLGLLMAFMGIAITTIPQKAEAQPMISVSFQTFYDQLSPYGTWYNDPQYGYVWVPNAGPDFRPYYTNGYWANTNYGNMWMSNYAWGWAPFHYGRWTFNNSYGWIWIPGNEWGPAWVNWRQGGGYYGWAPLGPGISISLSFGNSYYAPYNYWTFIPYRHLYARNYGHYYMPGRTQNIYNHTTIINNVYNNTYITGPRGSDYTRQTGQRVTTYNVQNSNSVGQSRVQGNNIAVYRPSVNRNTVGSTAASPRVAKSVSTSIVTTPRTNTGRLNNAGAVNQSNNGTSTISRGRLNTTQTQPQPNNSRTVNPATNNSQSNSAISTNPRFVSPTPATQNGRVNSISNQRVTAPAATPQIRTNTDNNNTRAISTPANNRITTPARTTTPARSNSFSRPTSFRTQNSGNTNIRTTPQRSSNVSQSPNRPAPAFNTNRSMSRQTAPAPRQINNSRSGSSFSRPSSSVKSSRSVTPNRSVRSNSESSHDSRTRFNR